MNPKDYIENVLRTESVDFEKILSRMTERGTVRLLHAGMGMATEAGEFVDALKKHVFYGRQIDPVNLKEELGDLLWYVAIAMDQLGLSFEEVMERNIEKLKARYAGAFTETKAENRDLQEERKVLEQPTRVATPINTILEAAHTARVGDLQTETIHRTVAIGGKKEESHG